MSSEFVSESFQSSVSSLSHTKGTRTSFYQTVLLISDLYCCLCFKTKNKQYYIYTNGSVTKCICTFSSCYCTLYTTACGTLIILPCDKQNMYVIISLLLFYDDITVCSIFITMVKVRPFVGRVVFFVVLFF